MPAGDGNLRDDAPSTTNGKNESCSGQSSSDRSAKRPLPGRRLYFRRLFCPDIKEPSDAPFLFVRLLYIFAETLIPYLYICEKECQRSNQEPIARTLGRRYRISTRFVALRGRHRHTIEVIYQGLKVRWVSMPAYTDGS